MPVPGELEGRDDELALLGREVAVLTLSLAAALAAAALGPVEVSIEGAHLHEEDVGGGRERVLRRGIGGARVVGDEIPGLEAVLLQGDRVGGDYLGPRVAAFVQSHGLLRLIVDGVDEIQGRDVEIVAARDLDERFLDARDLGVTAHAGELHRRRLIRKDFDGVVGRRRDPGIVAVGKFDAVLAFPLHGYRRGETPVPDRRSSRARPDRRARGSRPPTSCARVRWSLPRGCRAPHWMSPASFTVFGASPSRSGK